jgi:hypothetical protein
MDGCKVVTIVVENGYCSGIGAEVVVLSQQFCCCNYLSFSSNNFVKSTLAAGRDNPKGQAEGATRHLHGTPACGHERPEGNRGQFRATPFVLDREQLS